MRYPAVWTKIIAIACPLAYAAVAYSYWVLCQTPPGYLEPGPELTVKPETPQLITEPVSLKDPNSRYCEFCRVTKTPRVHHCRTCGKCIVDMDHHCMHTNASYC